MRFTLYSIELAKKPGIANTNEGYNTDKLPMEHQVWFIFLCIHFVNDLNEIKTDWMDWWINK